MKLESGTQAYEILRLLCYLEEYPRQSIELLGAGNADWTRRVVKQLIEAGYIRLLKRGRDIRSLGIRKKGWLAVYPERAYMKQRLNVDSLGRYHRIAEAAAMMQRSGVKVLPEEKPDWQTFITEPQKCAEPCYWTSREIKTDLDLSRNFNSSRFVGFMAAAAKPYVVYNAGAGRMCWHDCSEAHTRALISRMVRAPTNDAIIFGQSMDNALEILTAKPDNSRGFMSAVTSYENMYFLPLAAEASQLLCRQTSPNWRRQLVDSLLTKEEQAGRLTSIECDGMKLIKGLKLPVLVACECNLPKLYRLKLALLLRRIEAVAVYCLDCQKNAYETYFEGQAIVLAVDNG